MSSSEGVGFGRDGSVVTITLARPEAQLRKKSTSVAYVASGACSAG